MNELALRQIRAAAERDRQTARAALLSELDNLLHDYCGRPHESCVCADNSRAGVVEPLPPVGARWQQATGRAA